MARSLSGLTGASVRSHVDGDISHVSVTAIHQSHHVAEKTVLHLVVPMNYKRV